MKSYNKLMSDFIKEEYANEEEEYNLFLYENTALDIEENYKIDKPTELSYQEFLEEILSTFDLIEVGLQDENTVYKLTLSLVSFTFRYLRENFYFDKETYWLWDRLYNQYKDKNHDYRNSAEKGLKIDGRFSFKNKIQDKISRLYSYYYNDGISVDEEKLDDTLKDLINYSMIFIIWYKKGMPRDE